jgi:LPXTG-site transpeptidase (sortase) family protein
VSRLRAGASLALILVGSIALAYPVLAYALNGARTQRLTDAVDAALIGSAADAAPGRSVLQASDQRAGAGARERSGGSHGARAATTPAPTTRRATERSTVVVPAPRAGQALGIIQIPSIGLRTALFEGVASSTLLVGPGHLPWTALPGTGGVSVVAAHRDLQFRNLKDVRFGDRIWLELASGTTAYKVVDVRVIDPTDRRIYAPDARSPTELRLMTCWPPSFVGPAPDRLLVSAVPLRGDVAAVPAVPSSSAAPTAAPTVAASPDDRSTRRVRSVGVGVGAELPAAPSLGVTEVIPMVGAAGIGLSSLATFAALQGRRRGGWFVAFLAGAVALGVALNLGLIR